MSKYPPTNRGATQSGEIDKLLSPNCQVIAHALVCVALARASEPAQIDVPHSSLIPAKPSKTSQFVQSSDDVLALCVGKHSRAYIIIHGTKSLMQGLLVRLDAHDIVVPLLNDCL